MTPIPRSVFYGVIFLGLFAIYFSLMVGPMGGIRQQRSGVSVQQARAIGLALYSYANDNEGKYPEVKSSTEVFQKLLDGDYVTDPALFYVAMAGKTRAVRGQKLKPENVSFDVTAGININSGNDLPAIFLTGYRVTYAPGSAAVPFIKPYPRYEVEPRTWIDWWKGRQPEPPFEPGIAVYYSTNSAAYKLLRTTPNGDSSIVHFVPPDFKSDGKTYRQLTPDGSLP